MKNGIAGNGGGVNESFKKGNRKAVMFPQKIATDETENLPLCFVVIFCINANLK